MASGASCFIQVVANPLVGALAYWYIGSPSPGPAHNCPYLGSLGRAPLPELEWATEGVVKAVPSV